MSSFAGYCYWCKKPVMRKTLFGTLHLCLTDEEKQLVRQQSQQQSMANPTLKRLIEIAPQLAKAYEPNGKGGASNE